MINSELIDKNFQFFLKIKMNVVAVRHVMLYVLRKQFEWWQIARVFYNPELIPEKCIKCYLCLKVCAFKHK